MPVLTTESLRLELRHFAAHEMQNQLTELSTAIQERIRHDLEDIIGKTLRSNQLLPVHETSSPQFAQNPEMQYSFSQTSRSRQTSQSGVSPQGLGIDLEKAQTIHEVETDDAQEVFDSIYCSDAKQTQKSANLSKANQIPAGSQKLVAMTHDVDDGRDTRRNAIRKVVSSHNFERCVLLVIISNTIAVAVQIIYAVDDDHSASRTSLFKAIDLLFLIILGAELALRLYAFRTSFFLAKLADGHTNDNRVWNVFDCFILGFQALSMFLAEVTNSERSEFGNLTVLRLFRILQIGRFFRLRRLIRVFRFLRIIVASVYHSWPLFMWAVFSLELVTFVFAMYFTALVEDDCRSGDADADLRRYFCSLGDSHLSLLMCVTGGVDWGEVERPLAEVGFFVGFLPFHGYLMFTLIVTMNVFTGVFVDSASKRAQQETEIHLVRAVDEVFKAADTDDADKMSKAKFEEHVSHPDVVQLFDAIDLDIRQAEVIFPLLDSSNDGFISCDEFLQGCLRLRRSAKALDLLILSQEVTHLFAGVGATIKANADTNQQILTHLLDVLNRLGYVPQEKDVVRTSMSV